jgi:DNA-binding transcriptional regulator YiaG
MKTIRDLREANHMTQRDVSIKLDVTTQTVSNWEVGRNEPTARQWLSMARLFGVDPREMILPFDAKAESSKADPETR